MSGKFKNMKLILFPFFLLCATYAWSFTLGIPEELSDQPPEKQHEWIRKEMQEGYELQKKAGEERYNERIRLKQSVSREMMGEAERRRRKIKTAAAVRKSRDARAEARNLLMIFIGSIIFVPSLTLLIMYWRKSKIVEVPVTENRETREVLDISETLIRKMHQRRSNKGKAESLKKV